MEVDSTSSEPTTTQEVESNSKEIEKLQKTLNRYIERQHDYDDLQRRIAEFEKRNLEQGEEIMKLKSNVESPFVESEAVHEELLRYRQRVKVK